MPFVVTERPLGFQTTHSIASEGECLECLKGPGFRPAHYPDHYPDHTPGASMSSHCQPEGAAVSSAGQVPSAVVVPKDASIPPHPVLGARHANWILRNQTACENSQTSGAKTTGSVPTHPMAGASAAAAAAAVATAEILRTVAHQALFVRALASVAHRVTHGRIGEPLAFASPFASPFAFASHGCVAPLASRRASQPYRLSGSSTPQNHLVDRNRTVAVANQSIQREYCARLQRLDRVRPRRRRLQNMRAGHDA